MSTLLTNWFSDQQIKAVCWTLIHSLWIGMIIALLAALVIMLTRKSAASLRYRLLCGILVLFVLAVSVVFYIEYHSPADVQANAGNTRIFAGAVHVNIAGHAVAPVQENPVKVVVNFLDAYSNIIFMVWLLFFVMKSLKMAGGLLYIQRLRNYKVQPVGEEFKQKIELFSRQIGIRQTVCLVQSELVKVPVAVGWLKPLILLPMGIVLQLTPEQLDGILWHELAHIYRRDYLVNILQGLVETVFFFNPGLLWLSSLIRAEREACCDDMVLSRMNHKANYLEALLTFGYGEYQQTGLAMGIGSGNQLRNRLKRMVSQENKRLSVAEKAVLTLGLVLLSAFTTISKDGPVVKYFKVKVIDPSGKAITKTMPVSVQRLPKNLRVNDLTPESRAKHTLVLADTAIRFVSVLFKHSDADLANNDISAMDEKGNIYHLIVAGDKLVSLEVNNVKVENRELNKYDYMLRDIQTTVQNKQRVRDLDIAAIKANSPKAKYKAALDANPDDIKYAVDAQKRYAKSSNGYVKPRSVDGGDPMLMKLDAMRGRHSDDSASYAKERGRAENVIADLVKDKVIPNAASIKWFGLSDTEFIVNGQKQPDEMQKRYMAKYGVHENYGLYYGPVQMYGTGVFIDADAAPVRKMQPKPKYMGARRPFSTDSNAWKLRQLIKQQQLFAAAGGKKRAQLIRQQSFSDADQYKKQEQLLRQQDLAAVQDAKRPKVWADQHETFNVRLTDVFSNITNDLVSANVVSNKSELIKFNLTNAALMVNDIKQPDKLHEQLKAKYLRQQYDNNEPGLTSNPNYGLHFNAVNGARGVGITSDLKGP